MWRYRVDQANSAWIGLEENLMSGPSRSPQSYGDGRNGSHHGHWEWFWGPVAFIAGFVVARFYVSPRFTLDGDLLESFLTSAGFGGLMAVVAAAIAFRAARHSAQQKLKTDRKDQWWARAEWALNQIANDNVQLGYQVLIALGSSEWADEHEADVIQAATEIALGADEYPSEASQAQSPSSTPR